MCTTVNMKDTRAILKVDIGFYTIQGNIMGFDLSPCTGIMSGRLPNNTERSSYPLVLFWTSRVGLRQAYRFGGRLRNPEAPNSPR